MISNEAIGDHPRSRGVYWRVQRARYARQGSSPLARGLQDDRSDLSLGPRIIPARAGFTASLPPGRHPRTDHPRSRGVYSPGELGAVTSDGSSPLARGLRLVGGVRQVAVRIIPARAGFTRSCPPASRPATDHPRSRGVYRTSHPLIPSPGGSSPLARGLPTGESGLPASDGIIPARAGFTRPRSAGPAEAADHPRSRGVYSSRRSPVQPSGGSSPLARGLRALLLVGTRALRIIPARAGFTQSLGTAGP